MFCEKCGGQVSPEDRACMHCGYIFKLNDGASVRREHTNGSLKGANKGNPVPPIGQNPVQNINVGKSTAKNKKSAERTSPLWMVANVVLGILIVGAIGIGGWLYFGTGSKIKIQEPREAVEIEVVEETEVAIDTTIVVQGDGGVDQSQEVAENSGEYMFPNGDSAYLTRADLASLSADELRIGRNEFYARHGRIFTDPQLQAYFETKSWYVPQYEAAEMDALGLSIFNEYEVANIELIGEME